ncbi:hypothetical protein P171DRAFT_505009 [Karstenula rhodostoma CBS 690.94]|uniref:NmrA-like domain-containing protein n=1 Tax=Karstenula rhodostoma CBS 690.94 TaxID=1392251 RepID=A0A9P4U4L0_9PLEO|nr:hypothetical protein P171DRAFT_505009 [Karstenula rhodostoma CBS 690.94]
MPSYSTSFTVLISAAAVVLIPAEFGDAASLARALVPDGNGKTVDAVFLNTTPTFADPEEEPADIPSIEAAKLRSKLLLEGKNRINDGPTREFLGGYFGAKVQIEYLVKTWSQAADSTGEEHEKKWTVIRPAWFMSNFLPPASANYWPEFTPSSVIRSEIPTDAWMMLVDLEDIGVVAARALLSPLRHDSIPSLESKTVNISSQALTISEAARILSDIAGVEIKAEHVGEGEAAMEVRAGNVQRDAQAWHATLQSCFEPT